MHLGHNHEDVTCNCHCHQTYTSALLLRHSMNTEKICNSEQNMKTSINWHSDDRPVLVRTRTTASNAACVAILVVKSSISMSPPTSAYTEPQHILTLANIISTVFHTNYMYIWRRRLVTLSSGVLVLRTLFVVLVLKPVVLKLLVVVLHNGFV